MIRKMKKLTLLLHHSEKDDFLLKLQRLGVVHVESFPEVTSAELERLIEMKDRNERAFLFLKKLRKEKNLDFAEETDKGTQLILDEFESLVVL